jgi:hypothetical protein
MSFLLNYLPFVKFCSPIFLSKTTIDIHIKLETPVHWQVQAILHADFLELCPFSTLLFS